MTFEELTAHEYFHNLVGNTRKATMAAIVKELEGEFGEDNIRERAKAYESTYAGVYDGATAMDIAEELCADVYAGINNTELSEIVNNAVERLQGEAKGSARYALVGKTADNIEVYETSPDTKQLSYKERIKKAKDLIVNQYLGRTARFLRNGHYNYATFDPKEAGKLFYGDNISDAKGYKAKVNAIADGDVFDLVESSDYYKSEPEKKTHSADHWDYYIKTVQIDGRVYDVLANVSYLYGEDKSLYSITLTENKKINPATPRLAIKQVKGGATDGLSTSYYAQNSEKINTDINT